MKEKIKKIWLTIKADYRQMTQCVNTCKSGGKEFKEADSYLQIKK